MISIAIYICKQDILNKTLNIEGCIGYAPCDLYVKIEQYVFKKVKYFEKMTEFGDSFRTSDSSDKAGDRELQEFLMVEKQKAQFNAQVTKFSIV